VKQTFIGNFCESAKRKREERDSLSYPHSDELVGRRLEERNIKLNQKKNTGHLQKRRGRGRQGFRINLEEGRGSGLAVGAVTKRGRLQLHRNLHKKY